MENNKMWGMAPAVFAVGKEYQIMIPTERECIMKVEVGGKFYYDAANGIMRSKVLVHKVTIPMEALDHAKYYTVHLQEVLQRKHKFPEMGECHSKQYEFRPVTGENIRAYHIADNHGDIESPVRIADNMGNIDFLILNGDLANHYGEESAIWCVYELASCITKGNIPIVFSRGNHDTRGKYAESFTENFPSRIGNTYYTFQLGSIWGMVLDCGEDKEDNHPEYGGLVCCHDFREKETEYMKEVIRHASEEYEAPGVSHKFVVCHIPFTAPEEGDFDIERDVYAEWTALLRDCIKPEMILSGHTHKWEIYERGSDMDAYGQPCSVVVGSAKTNTEEGNYFAGAELKFVSGGIKVAKVEVADSTEIMN